MVGEARAHVQGESLKARAALLTEASQLPDHQDGERSDALVQSRCSGSFCLFVIFEGRAGAEF